MDVSWIKVKAVMEKLGSVGKSLARSKSVTQSNVKPGYNAEVW